MKSRIIYIILGVFLLVADGCLYSSEGLKTNLEFLGQMVEDMIARDTTILALASEPVIVLENPAKDQGITQFLSTHISNALIQRGYTVFMEGNSSQSGMILSWLPERVSILYNNPRRTYFFGAIQYTRQAQIQLEIQLLAADTKRVEWSGMLESQKSDTISVPDLPIIEQDGLILGHPVRPNPAGLRKWFEPAVMVGLTGLIVYLFYSIRS
ncbi:hypothetical protein HQ585_02885 [candidate division KSB1 bacterium]|nr:hypothetical protein [candidate division KSB1 bacterium]